MAAAGAAAAQAPVEGVPAPQGELRHGRELLTNKQFAEAKKVFTAYLHTHPDAVPAELGVGDAQLGLHQYEAAELTYRDVVRRQPELWQAHKNLVVVEAALARWEEFDRERTVLRMARERGAPGISARESDVIDSFPLLGERWVVRAYFQPVGRSQARYNFERFSRDGRVQAYISLEDAEAAKEALQPEDVRVGVVRPGAKTGRAANSREGNALSLNWYTGSAHGIVRAFQAGEAATEPSYEMLRAEVIRWLPAHPAVSGAGPRDGRSGPAAQAARVDGPHDGP